MKTRFLLVALAAVFAAIMAYAPPRSAAHVDITQGPVLESVSDHSAVVAWSTNKDGSTVLNYGTDPRQSCSSRRGAVGREWAYAPSRTSESATEYHLLPPGGDWPNPNWERRSSGNPGRDQLPNAT